MSRRDFLGAAGSLTALARLGPVAAATACASPGAQDGFFSPRERTILAAVVARMVASGDPEDPNVASPASLDTIDGLCGGLDAALTGPMRPLLLLFEWGPLLFELQFSRFTRMDADAQDASLRAWATSRIGLRRLGFMALRNLAFIGHYSQAETWSQIGYAGPLLRRGNPA